MKHLIDDAREGDLDAFWQLVRVATRTQDPSLIAVAGEAATDPETRAIRSEMIWRFTMALLEMMALNDHRSGDFTDNVLWLHWEIPRVYKGQKKRFNVQPHRIKQQIGEKRSTYFLWILEKFEQGIPWWLPAFDTERFNAIVKSAEHPIDPGSEIGKALAALYKSGEP